MTADSDGVIDGAEVGLSDGDAVATAAGFSRATAVSAGVGHPK
jgi:hypothetical protein